MMLYPAMNDLLKQVPSRYQLVNVVAARARQIASEAENEGLMLEEKPVSIAISEIAEGCLPDLHRELEVSEAAAHEAMGETETPAEVDEPAEVAAPAEADEPAGDEEATPSGELD